MKNRLKMLLLTIATAISITACGDIAGSFEYAVQSAKEDYEWYNGKSSAGDYSTAENEQSSGLVDETIQVGDTFVVGSFKYTIHNIGNGYASVGGFDGVSFLRMDFTVENISTEEQFLMIDAKAYLNGNIYTSVSYMYDCPEGQTYVNMGGGRSFDNHIYFQDCCPANGDTVEIDFNGKTIVWKNGEGATEQTQSEPELYTPEPGEHFEESEGPSDFSDNSWYVDIYAPLVQNVHSYSLVDLQNDGQYELVTSIAKDESTYEHHIYEIDENFQEHELGSLTVAGIDFFDPEGSYMERGFLVSDYYYDDNENCIETLYHIYSQNVNFIIEKVYENKVVEGPFNNGWFLDFAFGGDIDLLYDIQ